MGRAIFGILLGFTLVFGVAFWARTCLPDPHDEGIEWLHREDVVVVQMKTVGNGQFEQEITMPEYTIYGDGAVITDGRRHADPGLNYPRQGHLTATAIRSLLELADDKGFFDFAYEQPQEADGGGPGTYIYVSSKSKANAVIAYNIYSDSPENDRWPQFERLQQVVNRLISTVGDVDLKPLLYDKAVFTARIASASDGPSESPPIDLPDEIDVSAVSTQPATQVLDEPTTTKLQTLLELGAEALAEDDRGRFVVGYRPVLPFEENFPEFEPPTQ